VFDIISPFFIIYIVYKKVGGIVNFLGGFF
jgi:hypothetical protein